MAVQGVCIVLLLFVCQADPLLVVGHHSAAQDVAVPEEHVEWCAGVSQHADGFKPYSSYASLSSSLLQSETALFTNATCGRCFIVSCANETAPSTNRCVCNTSASILIQARATHISSTSDIGLSQSVFDALISSGGECDDSASFPLVMTPTLCMPSDDTHILILITAADATEFQFTVRDAGGYGAVKQAYVRFSDGYEQCSPSEGWFGNAFTCRAPEDYLEHPLGSVRLVGVESTVESIDLIRYGTEVMPFPNSTLWNTLTNFGIDVAEEDTGVSVVMLLLIAGWLCCLVGVLATYCYCSKKAKVEMRAVDEVATEDPSIHLEQIAEGAPEYPYDRGDGKFAL